MKPSNSVRQRLKLVIYPTENAFRSNPTSVSIMAAGIGFETAIRSNQRGLSYRVLWIQMAVASFQ